MAAAAQLSDKVAVQPQGRLGQPSSIQSQLLLLQSVTAIPNGSDWGVPDVAVAGVIGTIFRILAQNRVS